MTMLDAALGYIDKGFPVFPLCWPNGDKCACGRNHDTKDAGKVPLTTHGLKDATLTQLGAREYWQRWRHANIGIAIIDGYLVLDVDASHGGYESLEVLQTKYGKLPTTWTCLTGGGGLHIWLKAAGIRNTVALAGYSGLDIRGVGGYVCAPPSRHRSGQEYTWIEDAPIAEAPPWLIELCTKRTQAPTGTNTNSEPILEGQRNHALASLAGTMQRRGMTLEAIIAALKTENLSRCQPPLPEDEVERIAKSIGRYPSYNDNSKYIYNTASGQNLSEFKPDKNRTENRTGERDGETKTGQVPLSERVEAWVRLTSGWFETQELDRDLGINTTPDKDNRLKIMHRLEERGIVERHQKLNKQFRFVNAKVTELNFKNADTSGAISIHWPLELERKVNIFPGNLAVIAGATNSGKTALMLNFIYLNQGEFPLYYFCSEMGESELHSRLEGFEDMAMDEWNFKAFDRSTNFADVVVPDAINIIDYLELTEDLWSVNTHLTAICHRIGTGIAIVALQKKVGQRWGRGQEFSAEKSKIYLSMDEGRVTITKGKSWAQKGLNPNGLRCNFKIVNGCYFTPIGDWHRKDQE